MWNSVAANCQVLRVRAAYVSYTCTANLVNYIIVENGETDCSAIVCIEYA